MAYEVPLPYDYDALEPTIDEATKRLHDHKHHHASCELSPHSAS